MFLLKLLLFAACLTCALGQFSLLSVPKPNRNSTKERKINSPNTVIHIKVGPKSTFSNESINSFLSNQSTAKPEVSSPANLAKRSTESQFEGDESKDNLRTEEFGGKSSESSDSSKYQNGQPIASNGQSGSGGTDNNARRPPSSPVNSNENESNRAPIASNRGSVATSRTPKYGFGSSISSFGDKLKPSFPSFENKPKSGFGSFGDQIKPSGINPIASEFGKLANETANKFKGIPIISDFLSIPSYFKVNSLKGAMDYMIKYGHLESLVSLQLLFLLFNEWHSMNGAQ